MSLPDGFREQIRRYFPDEWPALESSLHTPAIRAARLQKYTLRTNSDESARNSERLPKPAAKSLPWFCAGPLPSAPENVEIRLRQPVPWHHNAYYVQQDSDFGKTVYHELGGIYLQEPSATAAVTALDPKPHERILDLCAAPGSKATAIGRQLQGQTLLYANDVHPQRVSVLAQNLERAGIAALVTNNQPSELAAVWGQAFDAVLVDAPCSGEGMFRKDPAAIAEWSPQRVELCVSRQRDILEHAVQLVKSGGRIVYSTCTLNPLENEQVVAWACANLPVYLEPLPNWRDWEPGRPELAGDLAKLHFTRRLWPQTGLGEGHFVARFRVLHTNALSGRNEARATVSARSKLARLDKVEWRPWLDDFIDFQELPEELRKPVRRGDRIYLNTNEALSLRHLTVLRDGICIAEKTHNRLIPSHQFVMAVRPDAWRQFRTLDSEEVTAYMAGQTLAASTLRGFVALSFAGLPVSWGKSVPGRLNNLLPKGLRKTHLLT